MTISAVGIIAAGLFWWQLSAAHEEIGRLESGIEQARDANESLVTVNENLRGRISDIIDQYEADLEAARTAARQSREERESLQTALEEARNEREVIYVNNIEAADWADTPVPDVIADVLRQ